MEAKSGTFGFETEKAGNPTTQTSRPYENQDDKQKVQMEDEIKILEIGLAETKAENKVLLEKLSGPLSKHTPETFDMLESKCSECNKIFENNVMVQNHMDTTHYSFSFNCPQCEKDLIIKRTCMITKKSQVS